MWDYGMHGWGWWGALVMGGFVLLVVVGEFNAGKSAFVNALVGEQVLQEGVTPTTAAIHLLK